MEQNLKFRINAVKPHFILHLKTNMKIGFLVNLTSLVINNESTC